MAYPTKHHIWRTLFLALSLAISLIFLLPGIGQAHAILLRSEPARDAILMTAPSDVHMWFSEDLNPTTSTAMVVNSSNQRVDVNGSIVIPTNTKEMDVSLRPTLPPGVYVVIWRTQSADDGHVLGGSFIFNIANPDGTVPRASGPLPNANQLNSTSTGQLDGNALFLLLTVTLVDLCAVFWVGGQLWRAFVLDMTAPGSGEQQDIDNQAQQRFERAFSQPLLRILFIANIGVLLSQALNVTNGSWSAIFSPTLLIGLLSNGRFGAFWIMREVVIALAMMVGAYAVIAPKQSRRQTEMITWINLILGLALLIALTLSGHASSVSGTTGIFAVLIDWLHLLAASLWIGGMFYLSLVYLPVLKRLSLPDRIQPLLTTLARFSPLAFTGVIIMALSGPFNATVHMTSFSQLYTTAYGRTLVVKIACVGALLVTSAIHVFLFRPRLARAYQQYSTMITSEEQEARETAVTSKQMEQDVVRQTRRLTTVLRWEPLLGVAVLLCTGLLSVFAGTLAPVTTGSPTGQQTAAVKPFTTTVPTSDHKYIVTLSISPDRFGPNTFTVTVKDSNGKLDSNVGVSLYTTMLDMDMGTDSINLQPNGQGKFSANGDLSMAGHWRVRVQIRTPDNTLHEVNVKFTAGS